jgi:hypothetical protein
MNRRAFVRLLVAVLGGLFCIRGASSASAASPSGGEGYRVSLVNRQNLSFQIFNETREAFTLTSVEKRKFEAFRVTVHVFRNGRWDEVRMGGNDSWGYFYRLEPGKRLIFVIPDYHFPGISRGELVRVKVDDYECKPFQW